MTTLRRRWHRVVLLVLGMGGFAAPAVAQTSITLAWDANPEPSVAGYVVYVGNESGQYREQYDAGNTTSFVYPNVVSGRPYYFAVAAYESTRTVGPRSEELPFRIDTFVAPALTRATTAHNALPDAVCAADGGCYAADRVAAVSGSADSLTGTPDGRIFLIQNETAIRVVDAAGLIHEPALTAESPAVTFADVALDSEFARNRAAYVAEVVTRVDRRRELNVVRYREVGNVFGERAVIVAGLPMSRSGTAALAVDSARRLYVALPADDDRSDPYEGMVLRFEPDGSVSRRARAGSPLFANGYEETTSLVWDGARAELWLAGSDAERHQFSLAHLAIDDDMAPEWPRVPSSLRRGLSLRSTERGDADVVLAGGRDGVFRIGAGMGGATAVELISSDDLGGEATSAILLRGALFVSVVSSDTSSALVSYILRLRRD
jgi:hypothetical protein